MKALDNVFYKTTEIDLGKFKNKVVKINDNIYCQIEKNNINNRNECFDIFTKITKERTKVLDEKTLTDYIKEIKYINNDQILWELRISKEHYYELNLSENLTEKLNEWYSLRLPDKIYGKLTVEEYNAIFNIREINYSSKNYKEIEFLKNIIPFLLIS